ncbi:MAG TPA: histidine kinase [Terriglobales bacterium]|nr:histidine kinase [Terriglobales bacterium]
MLLGLLFVGRNYIAYAAWGEPFPWDRAFLVEMEFSFSWALLTPLVIALARRFPIERGRLRFVLPLHLVFGCLLAPISAVMSWSFFFLTMAITKNFAWAEFAMRFRSSAPFVIYIGTAGFWMYWVILGAYFGLSYYRLYREQKLEAAELEVRASRLQEQLARAQLDALKMRLHPHFLFNTLNTISVLMQEDVERANRMLIRLSELLRIALDHQGADQVPLRDEISFLERYLEIQQIRFEDRLSVRFDVEGAALEACVPALILQPLVENAVRHGVARRAEPGRVEVRARAVDGRLLLEVWNDGPGLSEGGEGAANGSGYGLANTRARLDQHYGAAQRFAVENARSGVLASIEIPFVAANAAEEVHAEDSRADR